MKIDTRFQKLEYLKKITAYISFATELLGDDLPRSKRYNIAQFMVGYQLADLMDFCNDKALDDLIVIGNKIIKK